MKLMVLEAFYNQGLTIIASGGLEQLVMVNLTILTNGETGHGIRQGQRSGILTGCKDNQMTSNRRIASHLCLTTMSLVATTSTGMIVTVRTWPDTSV